MLYINFYGTNNLIDHVTNFEFIGSVIDIPPPPPSSHILQFLTCLTVSYNRLYYYINQIHLQLHNFISDD